MQKGARRICRQTAQIWRGGDTHLRVGAGEKHNKVKKMNDGDRGVHYESDTFPRHGQAEPAQQLTNRKLCKR
jgi:hypothetical protein